MFQWQKDVLKHSFEHMDDTDYQQLRDVGIPVTNAFDFKRILGLCGEYEDIQAVFEAILLAGKESLNYINLPIGEYSISEQDYRRIEGLISSQTGVELGFSLRLEMIEESKKDKMTLGGYNFDDYSASNYTHFITIGELDE